MKPSVKKNFKIEAILFFSFFLRFLFPISPASAQNESANTATSSTVEAVPLPANTNRNLNTNNSISLTAIPPRLGDDYSLTLKPGEQRQVMVEIRNPSSQTLKVNSYTKDFILGGEDGETPIPVDDSELSGRWSLASWLSLDGTTHTLEPKASVQIPVLISVPHDAIPGGHYAMILHRPSTGQSVDATGSQINTQIGNLVYVIVEGQMRENLNITDFQFDNFHEKGPISYHFTVENDSSYHISPEGSIQIKNALGQVIADLPVTSNKNIFPDSFRQYLGVWNKGWGFGPYQAVLTLNYGQDKIQSQAKNSFWILPLRLIILIFLILIVLIMIVMGIKKKQMRMIEKAQKDALARRDAEEAAAKNKKITADNLADDSSSSRTSHQNDNDNLSF